MNKNWLIRTKNLQILGPVSKEKVKEFISLGKLTSDDEIGSGNGYWFFVSEQELLQKYIYGDLPQTFNPVAEAESIVSIKKDHTASMAGVFTATDPESSINLNTLQKDEVHVPSNDDLEYPDMDSLSIPDDNDLAYPDMDDLSLPAADDLAYPDMSSRSSGGGGLVLGGTSDDLVSSGSSVASPPPVEAAHEEPLSEGKLPEDGDLEYPDLGNISLSVEEEMSSFEKEGEFDEDTEEVNVVPPEKKTSMESKIKVKQETTEDQKVKEKLKSKIKTQPTKPNKVKQEIGKALPKTGDIKKPSGKKGSDRYLFVLLAVFVVFLVAIFFYYKKIFNSALPFLSSVAFPEAVAQTPPEIVKKKVYTTVK